MTALKWTDACAITADDIPDGTSELIYASNQPICVGVLPNTLYSITFEDCFNQPITEGMLPSSLVIINFGNSFNQPIGMNVLPDKLEHIWFGHDFCEKIGDDVLPKTLRTIRFGGCYAYPIDTMFLPDTVEFISFPCNYSQRIITKFLPYNLRYIEIGGPLILILLNNIAHSMYFSVIYRGNLFKLYGVSYPVLCDQSSLIRDKYELIGQEKVLLPQDTGIYKVETFDVIISPNHYQPNPFASLIIN